MADPILATPSTYIGMMLAMGGNILISFSLNVQKYFHIQNAKLPPDERTSITKSKIWWVGLLMMAAGELGNFSAFSFAPVFLIAPLGAVSVVSNAILAYKFLGETIRRRDVIGMVAVVVGATVLVLAAQYDEPELDNAALLDYLASAVFIVYIVILSVSVAALLWFGVRLGYDRKYVVVDILICSLLGSVTVMCAKGISTMLRLTFQGNDQMSYPLPYIMLVAAVGTTFLQIKFLNKAMENFGASEVVPVYYVLFTICSIVGGIVLFREFSALPPWNVVFFLLGCLCTFSGVYLITSRRVPPDAAGDAKVDAAETGAAEAIDAVESPSKDEDAAAEEPLLTRDLKSPVSDERQRDERDRAARSIFQVKLWGMVQMAVSVVFLVSGIVSMARGDRSQWLALLYGIAGLLLGVVGLRSAFMRDRRLVRYYFRGLLTLIFITTGLGVAYAIALAARSCTDFKIPGMAPEEVAEVCHEGKASIIVPLLGMVSVALPACCWGGCAFCARALLDDLHEAQRRTHGAAAAARSRMESVRVHLGGGGSSRVDDPLPIGGSVDESTLAYGAVGSTASPASPLPSGPVAASLPAVLGPPPQSPPSSSGDA